MTTYSRPGVYVRESILQQNIAAVPRAEAVAAFIGALPKGAETPTLISGWPEFTRTFGDLDYNCPMSVAAYMFFSNGGREVYVNRVTGTGAATAQVALNDEDSALTLTVKATSKGTWANALNIEVKAASNPANVTIFVYGAPLSVGGGSRSNLLGQYEVNMSKSSSLYAPAIINGISPYITVVDATTGSASGANPAATAGLVPLTGGANGAAITVADLADSYANFDSYDVPLIFNLPDVATWFAKGGVTGDRDDMVAAYGDAIVYAEGRGDGFVVIDIPAGYNAAEATEFSLDVVTPISGDATGSNAAAYYPWLTIPDNSKAVRGATKGVAPGAAMVGQFQATDTSRGVSKTPAGYNNRVSVAVGLETRLTNAELDLMNTATAPVNAIRVTQGSGIVVMGGRTLASTNPDRYINIRRNLIYLKKELANRSEFAVFENNDELLWKRIRATLSSFLQIYWQQGGLRGAVPADAFYVKCDKSTTSQEDISNGRVNIEVGVALEYPAEFVSITIGQITGSASVTQA